MAWVTPVTNRTLTDVQTRASKAFFSTSAWSRINGNTAEIKARILSLLALTVTTTTLTTPTRSTIPTATAINSLIANIEAVKAGACLPAAVGTVTLKVDYQSGNSAEAPDYVAVNAWENNQLLLYTLLPYAAAYRVRCGVAATGQPRFWQAHFRG